MNIVEPFYCIPEPDLHWYLTYVSHHVHSLHMHRSRVETRLSYNRSGGTLEAMVIHHVDNSLILGLDEFSEMEDERSKAYLGRPRKRMEEQPTLFNGLVILPRRNGAIKMTQTEKIRHLVTQTAEEGSESQTVLAQYTGVDCRPDTEHFS